MLVFRGDPKLSFFDRVEVFSTISEDARKALMKIGAFVRRSARGSIRSSPRVSRPDRPPRSHSRVLKDQIFFGWDAGTESMVVGPTLIFKNLRVKGVAATGPELLEFGGEAVAQRDYSFVAQRGAGRRKANEQKQFVRVAKGDRLTFEARPFMEPAYEKNVTHPKLRAAWELVS